MYETKSAKGKIKYLKQKVVGGDLIQEVVTARDHMIEFTETIKSFH